MKYLTVIMIVSFAVFAAFADDPVTTNPTPQKKRHTSEELFAMAEKARMKRTGGLVRKEGSARGYFVLVNAQSILPVSDLTPAMQKIDDDIRIQTKVIQDEKVNLLNPKATINKNSGQIGVVLAESDDIPALLTAPEEGWAVVNVRKLADKDNAKTISRAQCELLRAFALVGGCTFMSRSAILLRDVSPVTGLDTISSNDFGVEALTTLERSLPSKGVMPWHQQTYRRACQEGWAPQPTNEFQKAIWDKIHELPSKPLKIQYDPAAQKGKVTK